MAEIISPKMSLEGWNFKAWFLGNGNTVKQLFKVGLPLAISWAATNNPVYVGLFTIGGKAVLDIIEYYLKEFTSN